MDLKALLRANDEGTVILMRRPDYRDASMYVRHAFLLGFINRRTGDEMRIPLEEPALIAAYDAGFTAGEPPVNDTDPVAVANDILRHWPVAAKSVDLLFGEDG